MLAASVVVDGKVVLSKGIGAGLLLRDDEVIE